MEYIVNMLQSKLNEELRQREIACQMLERKGFVMGESTTNAFNESRRIADERIPQLVKALEIIFENNKLEK